MPETSREQVFSRVRRKFGKAWLLLEDGSIYSGKSLGLLDAKSTGELVFNTGMTGYQEILTDPSYAGQIVTLTFPEIGNYGIREHESENLAQSITQSDSQSNKIFARGLVIRNYQDCYSSERANLSLDQFLCKHRIAGIFGIDTREITRKIREKGCLKSLLITTSVPKFSPNSSSNSFFNSFSSEFKPDFQSLQEELKSSPTLLGANFLETVSTPVAYDFSLPREKREKKEKGEKREKSKNQPSKKIAVIDFGLKRKMLELLAQEEFILRVFPADFDLAELLAFRANGIFLSNGPGDPAACPVQIIQKIQKLIESQIPILGVCFGYQVVAIALGAKTFKLKFGHRGSNHPVQDLQTHRVFITSQNHGFAVDPLSFSREYQKEVLITHLSLNDQTLEGFKLKKQPLIAVQFHPEAAPGPQDTYFVFREFLELVSKHSF